MPRSNCNQDDVWQPTGDIALPGSRTDRAWRLDGTETTSPQGPDCCNNAHVIFSSYSDSRVALIIALMTGTMWPNVVTAVLSHFMRMYNYHFLIRELGPKTSAWPLSAVLVCCGYQDSRSDIA